MKKYLVVLFVIPLLFLSVHTTEASFFGDLWNSLFGSSVPATSLPAKADNSPTTSVTNGPNVLNSVPNAEPDTHYNPHPTTNSVGGGGTSTSSNSVVTPVSTRTRSTATSTQVSTSPSETAIVSGAPVVCAKNTAPSIAVVSPKGGEVYQAGQQITVKWTSCNVSKDIRVGVAVDVNNPDYKSSTELKMVPNVGSAVFTLPTASYDTNGNPYFLIGRNGKPSYKVSPGKYFDVGVGTSIGNNAIIGGSPLFTINAPAKQVQTITVLSPNGGESYKVGDYMPITWKSTGLKSTDLVNVGIFSGGTVGLSDVFALAVPAMSNSYKWKIPTDFYTTLDRTYTICVGGVGGIENGAISIFDCSDKTFIVAPLSTNPADRIVTTTQTVTPSSTANSQGLYAVNFQGQINTNYAWSHANLRGWFEYSTSPTLANSTKSGLATNTHFSVEGYFGYDNASAAYLLPNTKYYYRACADDSPISLSNPVCGSILSYTLPIVIVSACPISGAQSITVVSPNGGQVYQEGQQINVTWTNCNIPAEKAVTVDLQVYDANDKSLGNFGMTVQPSLNDGQQLVLLPTFASLKTANPTLFATVVPGAHFKILVGASNADHTGIAHDYSDDFFTINRAQP